jgi:hypothetical protein
VGWQESVQLIQAAPDGRAYLSGVAEFNPALLLNGGLLNGLHFALEARHLGSRGVITFDEEQGGPEENHTDAGGYRVVCRFCILRSDSLSGPRGDPCCFGSKL